MLFIHSLSHSSEIWTLHGPEESPAFYLANHGHDVWLLNVRGTVPSLDHESLDWRTDFEYWEYTWEDLNIDYTTTIQYILDFTNHQTLNLIVANVYAPPFFLGISTQPEWYNSRVSVGITLAPALLYRDSNFPPVTIFCINQWILPMLRGLGIPLITPNRRTFVGSSISFLLNEVCNILPIF